MGDYPYRQCACGNQIHVGGVYQCEDCLSDKSPADELRAIIMGLTMPFQQAIKANKLISIFKSYEPENTDEKIRIKSNARIQDFIGHIKSSLSIDEYAEFREKLSTIGTLDKDGQPAWLFLPE